MGIDRILLQRILRIFSYILATYLTVVLIVGASYYTRILLEKLVIVPKIKQGFDYYSDFIVFYWLILLIIYLYEKIFVVRNLLWNEIRKVLLSVVMINVIFVLYLFLSKNVFVYARSMVFMMFAYSLIFLPSLHYIMKKIFHIINIYEVPVVVIGDPFKNEFIYNYLSNDWYLGYKIDGYFGNKVIDSDNRFTYLGDYFQAEPYLEKKRYWTIIVSFDRDMDISFVNRLQRKVKKLIFYPNLDGISIYNAELIYFMEYDKFLIKMKNNLNDLSNKIIKYLFDYSLSILFFPFLLFIILFIGVLIKIDSKGSIFYSHERIGKNGKKIKVIKFRTMYENSEKMLEDILNNYPEKAKEWYENFKFKDDPRVTRFGRFLRKTSLDELPQIFNVLKGEMSLVGHRPVTEEELEIHYKDVLDYYYLMKPGITGIWQVSGRNDMSYQERVRLDVWYILNWSLWLDIVLLFKTIFVVVKGKGAY